MKYKVLCIRNVQMRDAATGKFSSMAYYKGKCYKAEDYGEDMINMPDDQIGDGQVRTTHSWNESDDFNKHFRWITAPPKGWTDTRKEPELKILLPGVDYVEGSKGRSDKDG